MPSSILTPAQATLSNPPDKNAPFCGMYVVPIRFCSASDATDRPDVADSSQDTPAHGATYSIARSPVFAQRYDHPIITNAPFFSLTLGTLTMFGAILPRSTGLRHPRRTVDVLCGAQGNDGLTEAIRGGQPG
jgi:hypothetical protein